jgi:Tol biopolymer transport system component
MWGNAGLAARLLGVALCACLMVPMAAQAAFPGENGKIAFSRDGNIYTINPDGSEVRQLTSSGEDSTPAWSPNGRRIAFTSKRDGDYEVYVMDQHGNGQTNLTDSPGFVDGNPAWAPGGNKIAFDRNAEGVKRDIQLMNADGSGVTNLTQGEGGAYPAWSPDGRQVAFVWTNLHVVNADGTGRTDLTHYQPSTRDNHHTLYSPDWAPDGERILFHMWAGGGPYFFYTLQVIRRDGTDNNVAWCCYGGGEGPWSPDGRNAVVSIYGGLFVLDASSTGGFDLVPRQIPNTTTNDYEPDWQPIVPAPQRADYKNAAQYCKALQVFLGGFDFTSQYKSIGKCVSGSRRAG